MKKKILLFFFLVVAIVIIFGFFFDNKRDFSEKCGLNVYRFEQDFFSINPDSFDLYFLDLEESYPFFLMILLWISNMMCFWMIHLI